MRTLLNLSIVKYKTKLNATQRNCSNHISIQIVSDPMKFHRNNIYLSGRTGFPENLTWVNDCLYRVNGMSVCLSVCTLACPVSEHDVVWLAMMCMRFPLLSVWLRRIRIQPTSRWCRQTTTTTPSSNNRHFESAGTTYLMCSSICVMTMMLMMTANKDVCEWIC